MTIIEKILAKASGAAKIAPGDLAVVDVDLVVTIDLSFSRGSWREVLGSVDSRDSQRGWIVIQGFPLEGGDLEGDRSAGAE